MRRIVDILLSLLFLMPFFSCTETGPEPPVMIGNSIFLPCDSEEQVTVTIETDGPWQIENSASWYSISPLNGEAGETVIRITSSESNTAHKERVVPFRLVTDAGTTEYYVIQAAADGFDEPEAGFSSGIDGGELMLEIGGNLQYSVESRCDWIEVMPGVEYGDSVLLDDGRTKSRYVMSTFGLSIGANSGEVRTGEVVLLADGKEYPVEIHQMGDMPADFSKDFFRRSAIMKFTGTWCINCPIMTEDLKKVMEANPDRIVLMNVYDVGSGALAFGNSQTLERKYGIPGYPTGVVNDIAMHANSHVIDGQKLFSELVNEAIESYPAKTTIGGFSSIQDGNIEVNLKIAAKESGNYQICVYLLENGLLYRQEGVSGDYEHNHVLRQELTELAGEELAIEGNTAGSFNMEVPVPDCVQDISNAYIVAFVTYAGTPETQGVQYAQYLNCGTIIDNVVEMPLNGFVFFEYEN